MYRTFFITALIVAAWFGASAFASDGHSTAIRLTLADCDTALRRSDGWVDVDAMVKRLQELGVTTYYWLVWSVPTDWDDLKLFLPKAAEAGLQVWVYLVPPSESPPNPNTRYSEPFRPDYHRWAEEIARLSLNHTNLVPLGNLFCNTAMDNQRSAAVLKSQRWLFHGVHERL